MIVRIQGVLESVGSTSVLVQMSGGFTYEVLVPAYTSGRLGLSINKPITLHTLQYIESQNQGASLTPRLAGFSSEEDRRFFELFTTVRGIGNKKALKAMAMATQQIAAAIADRDAAMLQSLPEIGKRMAETIIATLSGKVDAFLTSPMVAPAGPSILGDESAAPVRSVAREALEVLVQLGENRVQALNWVEQAMNGKDRPTDVQAVLNRVYQIKAGG